MREGKQFDELRDLLAEKFHIEKKRLKTYGTKADSFDLANAVARHVQVLNLKARKDELKRALKSNSRTYLKDELRAVRAMLTAIQHAAEEADKRRPYNPKPKEDKGKKCTHCKKYGCAGMYPYKGICPVISKRKIKEKHDKRRSSSNRRHS